PRFPTRRSSDLEADDSPGEKIDDDSDVYPLASIPDFREVRRPYVVRTRRDREGKEIGMDDRNCLLLMPFPASSAVRADAVLAHHTLRFFPAHPQCFRNAPRAVGRMFPERFLYAGFERPIFLFHPGSIVQARAG